MRMAGNTTTKEKKAMSFCLPSWTFPRHRLATAEKLRLVFAIK